MTRHLGKQGALLGLTAALALAWVGCKPRVPASYTKAQPVDRKVLGEGVPYKPSPGLTASRVNQSMEERRRAAWEIVHRVTADVPIGQLLSEKDQEAFGNSTQHQIPLWQTWYEGSEFKVMFRSLMEELGQQGRLEGKPFCPEDLEKVFAEHAKKKLSFRFPPSRFQRRLTELRGVEAVRGVSGTGVTLFSPAVLFHYYLNYRQVYECGKILANVERDTPPYSPQNFAPCFAAEFPSGRESPFASYAQADLAHCATPKLTADAEETSRQKMGGAVAIKTSWQQVTDSAEVGVFDTDVDGMQALWQTGEWRPSAVVPAKDIADDEIYTVEITPTTGDRPHRHVLTGLHIVTKDIRDWMWISLWWSPEPDGDFGADRPEGEDDPYSFDRKGPWRNYKLCVVSGYDEQDMDPAASFADPTLRASLDKVHSLAAPHTWCSNPFVEQGKGNARTNCIGCHQHAGTQEVAEEIFLDDPSDPDNSARRARFPHGSRAKVRANFPADYLWSFAESPDYFQLEINEVIGNFEAEDR